MKQFIITAMAALCCIAIHAQSSDRILLGTITKDSLLKEPYSKWFTKNYADYTPEQKTKENLYALNKNDVSIEVFFGNWCGDSKRELPRFIKTLEQTGFDLRKVKLIAVGSNDSLYKQSPTDEHKGKGIYRVPAFIIYKNDKEVNRITEFPAYTLEKDLLQILTANNYQPNYKSYNSIKTWIADGTFADTNIAPRSLALQLKQLVSGENELNTVGYVLIAQGLTKEAVTVFRMNANLFPESANVYNSLGEGYLKNGEKEKAALSFETSITLSKDAEFTRQTLKLLYTAKGVK